MLELGSGRSASDVHHLAALRQVAAEIGDRVGEPLAGLVVGGARALVGARPHRGDDGDQVLDIVEDRHDRRPQEHRNRAGRGPAACPSAGAPSAAPCRSPYSRTGRPPWAAGRAAVRCGIRRPARAARRARRRGRARTRVVVDAKAPVDLGLVAAAAPDEIGLEADHRIAPADRAALDGFQQEAVGAPVGEFQHGRRPASPDRRPAGYRRRSAGPRHRRPRSFRRTARLSSPAHRA